MFVGLAKFTKRQTLAVNTEIGTIFQPTLTWHIKFGLKKRIQPWQIKLLPLHFFSPLMSEKCLEENTSLLMFSIFQFNCGVEFKLLIYWFYQNLRLGTANIVMAVVTSNSKPRFSLRPELLQCDHALSIFFFSYFVSLYKHFMYACFYFLNVVHAVVFQCTTLVSKKALFHSTFTLNQ